MLKLRIGISFVLFFVVTSLKAAELKIGEDAPLFKTKTHTGSSFDLNERKGHWTVLYFYPKAGTPGCTTQACAFRDSIEKIRVLDGDVFGISADSEQDLAKFHKEHHLNFKLLADPSGKVLTAYGAKRFGMNMAQRWTFIIDPKLQIRAIDKDVDPVLDASKVAAKIKELSK